MRMWYLRKLIKYEESLGVNIHQKDYYKHMYNKTTASYRAKVDAKSASNQQGANGNKKEEKEKVGDNGLKENEKNAKKTVESKGSNNIAKPSNRVLKDVNSKEQPIKVRGQSQDRALQLSQRKKQQQAPSLPDEDKSIKSGSSQKTVPERSQATAGGTTARTGRATKRTTNAMWIRPRSKTPHCSNGRRCKMDPVQLYQYYRSEWDKFSNHLPGENPRSDLRWQIRHKLLVNDD